MPVTKKNTTHKTSSKKVIIVIKSKVAAKLAADNKLEKVNKILGKTKWLNS